MMTWLIQRLQLLCCLQKEAKFVGTTSSYLNILRWEDQKTLTGIHKKTTGLVLTQIAVCGTALAGGGRVGVMGVIPIFLWIPEAGAALAGWGESGNLVGMGLLSLPKHQPQIHFGRQQGSTRQLRIPGTAGTDWYLAADETERHALFSHENAEYSLPWQANWICFLCVVCKVWSYVHTSSLAFHTKLQFCMKISERSVKIQQDENICVVETVVFIDNKQGDDKRFTLLKDGSQAHTKHVMICMAHQLISSQPLT